MSLLGLTWYSVLKNRDTADDYFLAGRNLGWFVVAASIFSTNIGSEHLVGLAGSGCTDGVAMAHYELHAWCLLVLAWVFVPFYARSMVFTMPEFLEKRYSPTARWVLSIISLVAYIVTKLAVGIFAGGVVFAILLPELKLDAGVRGLRRFLDRLFRGRRGHRALHGHRRPAGRGLYRHAPDHYLHCRLGDGDGVRADQLGGWEELRTTCGSNMFNLWKPLVPAGMEATWAPVRKEIGRMAWYFNDNFPWLGMLFCAPIVGLWYWCTDQYIVQRALAAPNETIARRGSIAAAFMKLLPVFIFIIPGMICFALAKHGYPGLTELVRDGQPVRDRCQAAFPLMVKYVLPMGIRGLVVAGLLAALMSSLAGAFNACSTLFTMDLYVKFRPHASQHQLVWIGRVATTMMVLIALLWIPVIRGQRGLYFYLQAVQGYLAPPIFVVFFLGVFNKRLNSKGCLSALMVGFVLGIFRLIVDTPVQLKLAGFENGYPQGSFLWIVNNIYFQYYSVLICLVCVVVMLAVSYATAAPSLERIRGLTYATVTEEQRRRSRASWAWGDLIASVMVLVGIAAAYLYFTG